MKGGTVTLFLMFSMSNSTCPPFPNGSRKFRLSSVSTFKRSRTLFPVLTFTFWNCLVWLIVTALMVLKKPVRAQVFVVQNSSSFRGLLGSKSEWKEGYQSKASVEGPTPFNILPPIWLPILRCQTYPQMIVLLLEGDKVRGATNFVNTKVRFKNSSERDIRKPSNWAKCVIK